MVRAIGAQPDGLQSVCGGFGVGGVVGVSKGKVLRREAFFPRNKRAHAFGGGHFQDGGGVQENVGAWGDRLVWFVRVADEGAVRGFVRGGNAQVSLQFGDIVVVFCKSLHHAYHRGQNSVDTRGALCRNEHSSGGIIGMGESFAQRVELACTLADLEADSIPLNILQPIKNTPLENAQPLSREEILRAVAVFKIANPRADIRFAGGRAALSGFEHDAMKSGASAFITGDMLTTAGSAVVRDFQMLSDFGYEH